jgi:hypothetical protein
VGFCESKTLPEHLAQRGMKACPDITEDGALLSMSIPPSPPRRGLYPCLKARSAGLSTLLCRRRTYFVTSCLLYHAQFQILAAWCEAGAKVNAAFNFQCHLRRSPYHYTPVEQAARSAYRIALFEWHLPSVPNGICQDGVVDGGGLRR